MEPEKEVHASSATQSLHEETQAKLKGVKASLQAAFGQVVLAMSSLPRYRHQTIADLSHLAIEPLVHDRIAIATLKSSDVTDAPAIAIWASVSEAVDLTIAEQVKAGVFPIRLKPNDWKSGEIVWLLDVIAPSRDLATAVVSKFNSVTNSKEVKVHPIVSRLVDPEIFKKLTYRADQGDQLIDEKPKALN